MNQIEKEIIIEALCNDNRGKSIVSLQYLGKEYHFAIIHDKGDEVDLDKFKEIASAIASESESLTFKL